MKKKFKDTAVGRFLSKNGSKIVHAAGDLFPPLGVVTNMIAGDPDLTLEQKQEAQRLVLEEYRLEIEDRKSARTREVSLAQAGKVDYMMIATGAIGLLAFVGCVLAIIFMPQLQENKLFIHLVGMIEGIVVTKLYSYYYGTSKGSKDKQNKLEKLL
ncbi:MAG: hypothetical protein AAFY41_13495 [Bacteroidota bacterium]